MTNFEGYPVEKLDENDVDDDGTMPNNVAELAKTIVGRRVVSVERNANHKVKRYSWEENVTGDALVLDDGTRVLLVDTSDCCAYTELNDVVLNLDKIDHVITGVGTTEGFTKWHIYADLGDVAELTIGWSSGNPFYYGYGFDIYVIPEEQN